MKGERDAHTLQTTALVHEAYLKLGDRPREFADRAHFLAVASRVMRQVLVDYARARTTMKRGGDLQPLTLTTGLKAEQNGLDQVELLRLDAALTALANENGSLAQLIELRYFDDGRGNRCGAEAIGPHGPARSAFGPSLAAPENESLSHYQLLLNPYRFNCRPRRGNRRITAAQTDEKR